MSYALACWLDSLGVRPQSMIGHSIGEYAAACVAGVMTTEEAVAAVVARGEAMFGQPRGAMLAVRAPADVLAPMLPSSV
ncbi:acyltransferase domain-containing protein, partial [Escherichia coli]|nr:acyltransferase domain-containing protein [Escherichia coli]